MLNSKVVRPEIWNIDDGHDRFAFAVGGRVQYVGPLPECERRKTIYLNERIAVDTSNELLRAIR